MEWPIIYISFLHLHGLEVGYCLLEVAFSLGEENPYTLVIRRLDILTYLTYLPYVYSTVNPIHASLQKWLDTYLGTCFWRHVLKVP